jgi:hypothetical protein
MKTKIVKPGEYRKPFLEDGNFTGFLQRSRTVNHQMTDDVTMSETAFTYEIEQINSMSLRHSLKSASPAMTNLCEVHNQSRRDLSLSVTGNLLPGT